MKESFILYTEYAKHMGLLSMEQRGVLFTAIMCYQTGEALPEMDGATAMAYSFIQDRLEKDNSKYEETIKKRSECGKQGGRPKANESTEKQTKAKKANAFSEKQTKAKKPDNELDYDNVLDNKDNILDPPIIPPKGETVGGQVGEVIEKCDDYLAFMESHPSISMDLTNPSEICSIDFPLLSEKIAESPFLQTRYSLSWLLRNYRKIIAGAYKPFNSRGAPPGEKSQIEFLKQLYDEAVEEDARNAEKDGCEDTYGD